MSLINDMLNDLDDRRGKNFHSGLNLDWMTGQKETSKNRTYIPILMGLIFITLLFTGWKIWASYSSVDNSTVDDFLTGKLAENSAERVQSSLSDQREKIGMKKANKKVVANSSNEKKSVIELPSDYVEDVKTGTLEVASVKTIETQDLQQTQKIKEVQQVAKESFVAEEINKYSKDLKSAEGQRSDLDRPRQKFVRSLSPEQQDSKLAKAAGELVRKGRVEDAEKKLLNQLDQYPLSVRSGELLATIWLSQQRNEEVRQLLVPLRNSKPRDIGLITIESRLLIAAGQYKNALTLLMSQEPALSDHVGYYELLALAARQSKQYPLSAQVYRGLLENNTQRGDWWAGMGIALDMQAKTTEARSAYRNAIESPLISVALKTYAQQRLSVL